MSSTTPSSELNAALVIARIEDGSYPRETILHIARGFLPLPQEDLITVVSFLATSTDVEAVGVEKFTAEMKYRVVGPAGSGPPVPFGRALGEPVRRILKFSPLHGYASMKRHARPQTGSGCRVGGKRFTSDS